MSAKFAAHTGPCEVCAFPSIKACFDCWRDHGSFPGELSLQARHESKSLVALTADLAGGACLKVSNVVVLQHRGVNLDSLCALFRSLGLRTL